MIRTAMEEGARGTEIAAREGMVCPPLYQDTQVSDAVALRFIEEVDLVATIDRYISQANDD